MAFPHGEVDDVASGRRLTSLLDRAQHLVSSAVNNYAHQVASGSDPTRINLDQILTPQQIAELRQMQQQGTLTLRQGDLNRDGVIDARDLSAVLQALDDVNTNSLPPSLRAMLATLDTNGDGVIDQQDLQPIIASLELTTVGRAILVTLRRNDGTYDPNQMLAVFSGLLQLGAQHPTSGGHLDLSGLPTNVQQVLLSSLDHNGDGNLDPADIAGFVLTLTEQTPNGPPPPPSPPPTANKAPPPPPPMPPGHVWPPSPPLVPRAASPPLPPAVPLVTNANPSALGVAGAGGGAGGTVAIVLCLLLVVGGGAFGFRWWRKNKGSGRQRMLEVSVPSMNTSYNAPLPTPLVGGASTTLAASCTTATPNQGLPPV